jgi:integrase
MTLEEWCERWLNDYAKPNLRPGTISRYSGVVYRHIIPNLGAKVIRFIKSSDIRRFYANEKSNGRQRCRHAKGKGLSDTTIRGIHMLLHEILESAVRAHLIPSNPCDGVAIPKNSYAPKKILTEAELDRFMKAIAEEPLWYDFFYTEATTGLRRGEICGLKWEDIDFDSGRLSVRRNVTRRTSKAILIGETKTNTGKRSILLPPSTLHLLKRRREKITSEWVFPDFFDNTVPVAPHSAYHKLKAILKKADLPDIRFHDLRHTFATHALASGVDAKTLSGILGHTDPSFTLDTYTHVTSDMHQRAKDIVGSFLDDLTGGEEDGEET